MANIFFICYPPGPPEKAGYEHQAICLAEGLTELGCSINSNFNVWQKDVNSNNYLLSASSEPESYRDCDIVLFTSTLFNYERLDLLPADLYNKKRKYKLVLLDDSDGPVTPGYRTEIIQNVDLVLKSHYTTFFRYPKNFYPWQFGLSNRIINAVEPVKYSEREKQILVNFRVKHGIRDIASKKILPIIYKKFLPNTEVDLFPDINTMNEQDKLYWQQTGRRHYPYYYERLSNTMACACFGGEIYNDNNISLTRKIIKKFYKGSAFNSSSKIYQFDSWRFWEALVAGCCVFHIDIKRYGAVLPINPVNGKHYIGVNLLNPNQLNKIMKESYSYFEDIGSYGREWALNYYTPKKMAERFLELVNAHH
ncbi:MAG: hypothetical protein ABIN97_19955 [Ginsengibacter sp.]